MNSKDQQNPQILKIVMLPRKGWEEELYDKDPENYHDILQPKFIPVSMEAYQLVLRVRIRRIFITDRGLPGSNRRQIKLNLFGSYE